ncbi:hypothetical protein BH24ACT15_BH24ACT15_23100 [soil metagenome]
MSDELIRQAKVLAAQRDTSVSALVGELLQQVVGQVEDYGTAWAQEERFMESGALRVGAISWSREDLHER